MTEYGSLKDNAASSLHNDAIALAHKIKFILGSISLHDQNLYKATHVNILEILDNKNCDPPNLHVVSKYEEVDTDVDNLTDFIKLMLDNSDDTLSVQQIFDMIEEAEFEVSRKALVVHLFRMKSDGVVVAPSRGHYRLADNININTGRA